MKIYRGLIGKVKRIMDSFTHVSYYKIYNDLRGGYDSSCPYHRIKFWIYSPDGIELTKEQILEIVDALSELGYTIFTISYSKYTRTATYQIRIQVQAVGTTTLEFK